jgi:hypothetical protein
MALVQYQIVLIHITSVSLPVNIVLSCTYVSRDNSSKHETIHSISYQMTESIAQPFLSHPVHPKRSHAAQLTTN